MPKRRRSKAFWKNFKFKYKLTIVNENTLEEIVGLRVSKLNGLSVLLCVLAVLFLIASIYIHLIVYLLMHSASKPMTVPLPENQRSGKLFFQRKSRT